MLGLKIEKKVHEVYDVAGGIPVILKSTSVRINDVILDVRIGWSLREDEPFILGRLDFFNEFHIEFRENENSWFSSVWNTENG